MSILRDQYKLIQDARQIMLQFVSELQPADFVKGIDDFGNKSIRDTLVHVAHAYEFWMRQFSLKLPANFVEANLIPTAQDVITLYATVDERVASFIETFQSDLNQRIYGENPQIALFKELSVLTLFTHVITHEAHHKGQIMTMGRMLGYTPPDAAVIFGN